MRIMTNKDRIIEISKKLKLTHVGSCLSALPIYEEIYAKKKPEDIVIADNAHSHLAHLVVAYSEIPEEEWENYDIESQITKYGIHCDTRSICDASGGSLGHGLGIGIGYALADRKRDVYVIVSDGSMMEGSNWEALRIRQSLNLTNLKIYANFNGYSAVSKVNGNDLMFKMDNFALFHDDIQYHFTDNGLPELEGLQGHYKLLI